jgi:hypothetical protein
VKLAPLLAQYLYTNKRLDLPGIGTFRLDPHAAPEPENTKNGRAIPGQVSFENANIREVPDLITYISAQTRKLKALAAADLESHVELIQQFLNIGKPFLLEGIGNLVKIKSGELAFTSGQVMPESMKDYSAREISSTSSTEESFADYRKAINQRGEKSKWRKPVIGLLAMAGIALAVWGGYTVYKKNNPPQQEDLTLQTASVLTSLPSVPEKDTVTQRDTIQNTPPNTADNATAIGQVAATSPGAAPGKIRYILENATAKRAFERFAKLKTFFWPVQLVTKDSINYTLFLEIPSTYADTTRINDSLTALNGKRVRTW